MPEDVARFTVLLEDIQTQVRAIADGYVGLSERMDRMDARFDRLEARFDGLETRFDGFASETTRRLDKLETRFDGFASDTTRRLERIETHLGLNGPLPLRKVTRPATPRRRKKTAKSG